MDKSEIVKDLRKQHGGRSVLFSDDVARLLGKTRGAVASLKSRDGLPLPVVEVGGRWGVSVYAVADWLAGDAQGAEAGQAPEGSGEAPAAATSDAPPPSKHGGKRDHKSLGKFLVGLRGQRGFLAELDAKIEAEILAEEAAEAEAEARARDSAGSDGDERGSCGAASLRPL